MVTVLITVSCVGTVQDKNPETTKGASAPETPIFFEGIFDAIAISPDKVEVFFFPATGSPTGLTYLVNYDGSPVPITFPATTLRPDYRGLLKVTIDGLTINSFYTFTVQVKDETGNTSSNNATSSVRTFSNVTCDFPGVANVSNLSGEEGRNALRIEWPEARREGSDFVKRPIDPDQYEIIALDADNVTPAAFDDEFFSEPLRKVTIVDGKKISHQLNGLQPGTRYYIRVRCIHNEFNQIGGNGIYKREENTTYLIGETLSDDASSLIVDYSDFDVSPSEGAAGLNSFEVSWDPAQGAFNEYRIYYRNQAVDGQPWSSFRNVRNEVCDGQEPNDPAWYCRAVDFSQSSTTLADLDSLANYEVIGGICQESECGVGGVGRFNEYVSNGPYRTFPGLANFSGISSIEPPQTIYDLSTVYLNFTPPDLASGAADGLLIEAKARAPVTEDSFLNHPDSLSVPNLTTLTYQSFDYSQDSSVAVSGLSVGGDPYCFSLLPYIFDSEGENGITINRAAEVTRCFTLEYTPPTSTQFSGINIASTFLDPDSNVTTLVWDTPSGGQYDRFVILVKLDGTPGVFSFSDATNPLSANYDNYVRFEAPFGSTSYFLGPFPEGQYQIGVLTYFGLEDFYSEFNTNILLFDTTL